MHDHHAVEALIARLRAAGLTDVTEVRIQAGPAYSPAALRQAYEMLTLDTPLAGSHLLIEASLEPCVCPRCGQEWSVGHEDVDGHLALCPSCGTPSALENLGLIQVIGVS